MKADNLYLTYGKKLATLLLIVLASAYIYKWFLYPLDIHKYSDTLENLDLVKYNSDVIYFGESSNFYQEHPDTPKQRISQLIDQMLPDLKVGEVDNAGITASTYYHIMQHIPKDSKVKALIVTMNLRSFGSTWLYDKNFNYLHRADELIKQRPAIINRIMIGLKEYEHYSPDELNEKLMFHWQNDPLNIPFDFKFNNLNDWHNYKAYASWLNEDGSWDIPKIELTTHYIKNFAFDIDTASNPRIKEFDAIVKFAKQRGYKLVFQIMSENIQEGSYLLKETGKGFEWLLRNNTEKLIKRYSSEDVLVVNNLETVPNEHFRDRIFPTEHYNNYGKYLCAKNLVDELKAKNFFEK